MPFRKGNRLSGSRRGSPNRATQGARDAIAKFVDGNAHRLQAWLDAIADGVREPPAEDGTLGKWVVEPNPQKAFELFQSVLEYHVPKLSRAEVVEETKRPDNVIDSSRLSHEQRAQLRAMILSATPEQVAAESELLEVGR